MCGKRKGEYTILVTSPEDGKRQEDEAASVEDAESALSQTRGAREAQERVASNASGERPYR